jgi:glyoxylase-like metal-dependent hydrolase (beta-lactamase superfamily II)
MKGSSPNLGFYRYRLGQTIITALYDGYIDTSLSVMTGISLAEAEQLYGSHSLDHPARHTMTIFAISYGEKTILIDAGGTPELDPDLGCRHTNMLAAGIDPQQVSMVLLTHLHSDHYGSLVCSDGSATFPNAELIVPADEVPFRLEPADASRLTAEERTSFENARRAVSPYRQRMRTMREGEVLPGIHAVPLSGHTPGHTGWRIESNSEILFIAGDFIHFPSVQFSHPNVGVVYDTNPAQAIASRAKVLSEASREAYVVAGMHLDFPCFGHIAANGAGFSWKPTK